MSYSYLHDVEVSDANRHKYPPTWPGRSKRAAIDERSTADQIPELAPPNPSFNLPYDSGRRRLVLCGLVFALVTGSAFIITGIFIHATSTSFVIIGLTRWEDIALGLSFNALVTVCSEVTGYVHGTTLKWGLAKEGRLRFNANLRLFSATEGTLSVNGPVVSVIFTISIIFSYAASSTVFLHGQIFADIASSSPSVISFFPPIVLGVTLVLQAALGLIAFFNTHVLTWSSSPLDVTSALIHHGYIHHRSKRCMRSVSKTNVLSTDPIRPLSRQPSAWSSHKTVPRVVWFVWSSLVVWTGWFLIFLYVELPNSLRFHNDVTPLGPLVLGLLFLAAVQAVVTIVLHCCELVTTLARDELVWRAASTGRGVRPAGNPLMVVLRSWQSIILLLAKPAIHWFFGMIVGVDASFGFGVNGLDLFFLPVLFLVAVFITVVAVLRPSGPQPVAYGHIQTLADLVDEWSTTMYWGIRRTAGRGRGRLVTPGRPKMGLYLQSGWRGSTHDVRMMHVSHYCVDFRPVGSVQFVDAGIHRLMQV
ncbi:hypothetical protein FRB94_009822 [Tulasnella sp. JGI-2019a]|nr:hypothetical protein FRB94_009822 [Tulasnella sp. JGI-2019a]